MTAILFGSEHCQWPVVGRQTVFDAGEAIPYRKVRQALAAFKRTRADVHAKCVRITRLQPKGRPRAAPMPMNPQFTPRGFRSRMRRPGRRNQPTGAAGYLRYFCVFCDILEGAINICCCAPTIYNSHLLECRSFAAQAFTPKTCVHLPLDASFSAFARVTEPLPSGPLPYRMVRKCAAAL